MRLVRTGERGAEKPGALVNGDLLVDLSDVVVDYNEAFFASQGLTMLAPVIAGRAAAGQTEPLGARRIGAPFARPHQILCIGLNYRDHAAETGQAVPTEPIVFNKAPNTLIGPVNVGRSKRSTSRSNRCAREEWQEKPLYALETQGRPTCVLTSAN
jgi:2-keto-4-pentenoate hydratase/2-oxohepta-3-ene-1,7-dioic acid hydratase in catechol pathway